MTAANGATLRIAEPGDAPALLAIYRPYVERTAITFECTVPTVDEFRSRIEDTLTRYPYLVVQEPDGLAGYAYLRPFIQREAYDRTAQPSIYLRQDRRRRGYGRMLYDALEAIAKAQHLTNLEACITAPTTYDGVEVEDDPYLDGGSRRFHAARGYRLVGRFDKCGRKFDRWYDMVWMEKHIGPHGDDPAPLVPFSQLDLRTVGLAR